jgi:hypothetical protein
MERGALPDQYLEVGLAPPIPRVGKLTYNRLEIVAPPSVRPYIGGRREPTCGGPISVDGVYRDRSAKHRKIAPGA